MIDSPLFCDGMISSWILSGEAHVKRYQPNQLGWVFGAMILGSLACRPVITVGWGEILVLLLVIFLVVGPIFVRFFRDRKSVV